MVAPSNACIAREDASDDLRYIVPVDDVENVDVTVHSAVKMKLNTFCSSVTLVSKLKRIVADANVLLGEAYAFSNFHIRRILDDNATQRVTLSLHVLDDKGVSVRLETLPTRPIPLIDRNFFYRCLLAVATSKCRPGTLGHDFEDSIRSFDRLRPIGQCRINIEHLNQLVADLSIVMATMASNHLWVNIERRLHAYVKSEYPGLKGMWKDVVEGVVRKPNTPVDVVIPGRGTTCKRATAGRKTETTPLSPKVAMARNAILQLRGLLQLPSSSQYASRAHLLLPLYFHMLRHAETMQKKSQTTRNSRSRLFTLLPTKHGFTISNVPVSSMFLLKLLKTLKLEDIPGDGRTMDAMVYWRKYFNVNAIETRNRRFDGRIVTDGCAVTALLARRCRMVVGKAIGPRTPTQADLYTALALNQDVRIVGLDPGYHDVVTFRTYENGLESKRSESYSSARYYEKAKVNLSRHRTSKWNAETAELAASIPTAMTTCAVSMDNHVTAYLAALRPLTQHRLAKGYRNMRFLRYVHKRRAIEEICDMIAPPDASLTIVGFGDWKAGVSPISRRTSGPIEEIKLALQAREDVMLVLLDEYKTSVTCSCCDGPLVNMRAKSWDRKKKTTRVRASPIHRTLHCKSRTCGQSADHPGTTWNRDVNASRNLLELTLCVINGQDRPFALQRPRRLRF